MSGTHTCMYCGAVVIKDMAEKHHEGHENFLKLVEAVQSLQEQVGGLIKLSKELALILRDHQKAGFRGPAYDEPI